MHKPTAIVFGSYLPSVINFRKPLLTALQGKGYKVIALAPGNDEATEKILAELGVDFIQVPLGRTGFNPLKDYATLQFLKKLFKELQPEVVITYTIKPNIYGSWAAKGLKKAKVLAWITGLGYVGMEADTFKRKLVRSVIFRLYKKAFSTLPFIAFQNPDDQQFFKEHQLLQADTAQTITAGSGVDLAHYPKAEPQLNPIKFLLIARLIGAKGVNEYIAAAKNIKQKYPEVKFQLIGMTDEGNPDSLEETELKELHKAGIIDYLGFQSDVRKYLADCSVFVLPSYYREGTPRTILESLAMGKPIITTDNPGCRETIDGDKNGYLIPVKDTNALGKAMQSFIENPASIKEKGEESYRLATEKYDVNIVNEHLFSFMGI
ncbi:Glycosyltransferase involved in cell wall bisynthesis [Marivirga sericea]|uniref:Glycosyltransferase involved in cell wall bisynthesis n=1 Tax=Marivirga sericea TaxID=1028 RepID=A0A1X7IK89_9BACT|nr:glycosyltransferase family 4 protein [Marivirga sericea]SMG14936.1 Glycosyltransferase involved in cell wall bisynthesis [Marivirga sericea]